jgi:hypothetical protein
MFHLFKGSGEEGIATVDEGIHAMSCVFEEFVREVGARAVSARRGRAAAGGAGAAGAGGAGAAAPAPLAKKPSANDAEYVNDMIAILLRMKWLTASAFHGHAHMGKGLLRGMERVLAMDEDSPEIIATYLDTTLQGRNAKGRIGEVWVEGGGCSGGYVQSRAPSRMSTQMRRRFCRTWTTAWAWFATLW